jgi:hypothetical protein
MTASHEPRECRWTLHRGANRADCEFRITIDLGYEAQLLKDGEIVSGQLFKTRTEAEQWASQQRERLMRQGWQAPDVPRRSS